MSKSISFSPKNSFLPPPFDETTCALAQQIINNDLFWEPYAGATFPEPYLFHPELAPFGGHDRFTIRCSGKNSLPTDLASSPSTLYATHRSAIFHISHNQSIGRPLQSLYRTLIGALSNRQLPGCQK